MIGISYLKTDAGRSEQFTETRINVKLPNPPTVSVAVVVAVVVVVVDDIAIARRHVDKEGDVDDEGWSYSLSFNMVRK